MNNSSSATQTQSESQNENPGLAPYDLTGYNGIRGRNFFTEDRVLNRIFLREALHESAEYNKDVLNHLNGYGKLVGGILDELTETAHKEDHIGHIDHYDRTGERIDEIRYCAEQLESRKISYQYGLVNLDSHSSWKHQFGMFHRMALAYMANQNGEGGVTCPMAMTDGMIRAIQSIGTDDQKKRYLPMIAGENSSSYFMCGQYVTERVGGSNVGANRTVARKVGVENGTGKWLLTGEKWFASNPGDLWVTTARIEGTNRIGLFLVPRLKADGTKNGFTLLRKKEIIGSRGKLTAECVYQNCEAEELGRPAHGLANLIKFVINISRIHVGSAAIGMSRRAIMEGLAYVRHRTAYGRHVIDFPVTKTMLVRMSIMHTAAQLANFRSFAALDQKNPLSDLLTPMMKYISTVNASWAVRQSILLHGGNGILSDFNILPRLLNDAIINETWEGAHPVIQDHVMKALGRQKVRTELNNHFESVLSLADEFGKNDDIKAGLQEMVVEFQKHLEKSEEWLSLNKKSLVEQLFRVYGMSLIVSEALLDSKSVANSKVVPNDLVWKSTQHSSIAGAVQNENQIYANMARGLIEINRQSLDGLTEAGGIFEDNQILDNILDYMASK
ncbi:MAG: acyl-CoA dehydrogenase family protein [Leptonema sp. (in: Bacteria)]|nr:acyl-CoA dehydrogenase family protein [Leptonema sp. (in: bacteria)]